MRIRLAVLLPLVLSVLVGAGFLLAALTVGDTVRMAQPGYRAAEATRIVVLWGIGFTAAVAIAAALMARMIVRPLHRMRDAALRIAEAPAAADTASPVAEIQDILRGIRTAGADLRERHARELRERAELAALVDAVSEGILQVDGAGRIVRLNPAAGSLLGLPADAIGRTAASLVRNADLRRALEDGREGGRTAVREIAVDERRLLIAVTPLAPGGAVATIVDLTDLRRLEEIRRDFVANASHELKTPLTSIRGYAETLLADDTSDQERRGFLQTIARNAERLQRIVDDLLDLSRLESGRWQPDLAAVPVTEVAESTWRPFAPGAARKGVAFELEGEAAVLARADRRALEQVFSNLYDNALRHTPDGGRILVRASGGADGIVIDVVDTGSGIPRDALPRIFERFYRVDPARSRAEGGTGLGLSIVRHLLESMGGSVTAESVLGKGTTIRFRLPPA